MPEKENERSQVQSRSATDTVLRDKFFDLLGRAWLLFKSLAIFIGLKIRYGKRIKMHPINSIRGKFSVQLKRSSSLKIGSFLMTTGPIYIKGTENSEITIGNHCFFNHNVSLTCDKKIEIGDECNIANNVVIVDHDHKMKKSGIDGSLNSEPVKIGNKVWLGANTIITKGVTIGDGSVVAAGGVAVSNIPPHFLYGGLPAKKIKEIKE